MRSITCPVCDSDDTEFVQFADGSEEVTEINEETVGNGVLDLRICNDCGAGIETVLTPSVQVTVTDD